MTQDFYIGMVVGSAIATVIWIALGLKKEFRQGGKVFTSENQAVGANYSEIPNS